MSANKPKVRYSEDVEWPESSLKYIEVPILCGGLLKNAMLAEDAAHENGREGE